jgi:hypothetical protein
MSGRPECLTAQEVADAHIVKAERHASTTLLLPKHQDKSSTGIRTKTPRHLSRRLLAVPSELSGSAPSAAMNGSVKLHSVCRTTADVLVVDIKLVEGKQSNPHLKQHVISCCVSGTMSAMLQMAFIPTPPPFAAKSWCIGSATTAPRNSCTCIKCVLMIVLADACKGVHIVLVVNYANATLCKLITPCLHQSGTFPEMT